MPDTPSITIIKRFTYRGSPEEWSNTYHFSGTVPTSDAEWKTLADAIILAEKPLVTSATTFVKAYGYVAGNENSVAQIDYTAPPLTPQAGSMTVGSASRTPGDIAATVRWYTGASSERGKKIYCRKYFHDVLVSGGSPDTLYTGNDAIYLTYANKMIDGTLPGSFKYCGPQGATLSSPKVNPYTTTRTLKRRGKRPPTGPS